MRLEITVSGVPVVARDLARFAARAQDPTPAEDAIARVLAQANRRNFDTEGAAGAFGRWAPLSPGYAAWKAQHYPGRKILVRTGALRRSLTELPLGVQDSTRTTLRFGTDVPYARYHQTGTSRMPRRAPVALTEQVKRDMVKVLQRFLVTGQA